MSPKLANSDIDRTKRRKAHILNKFSYYDNVIWKFVISYSSDIREIQENYEKPFNLKPDQIYLMPQGITAEDQINSMPHVMEDCIKYGYNFSPRLQVLAYNDERRK